MKYIRTGIFFVPYSCTQCTYHKLLGDSSSTLERLGLEGEHGLVTLLYPSR